MVLHKLRSLSVSSFAGYSSLQTEPVKNSFSKREPQVHSAKLEIRCYAAVVSYIDMDVLEIGFCEGVKPRIFENSTQCDPYGFSVWPSIMHISSHA